MTAMVIMRGVAFALLLAFATMSSAADVLPSHVVGIWATRAAVLRGEALFEGQGLYLDTDGVGAIIAGPPPIGMRIIATYDSATNVIVVQMTEHGKTVGNSAFTYDPTQKLIRMDKVELHRRFDRLSPTIRKSLGLEAKSR